LTTRHRPRGSTRCLWATVATQPTSGSTRQPAQSTPSLRRVARGLKRESCSRSFVAFLACLRLTSCAKFTNQLEIFSSPCFTDSTFRTCRCGCTTKSTTVVVEVVALTHQRDSIRLCTMLVRFICSGLTPMVLRAL
jgi:hypothetical protein